MALAGLLPYAPALFKGLSTGLGYAFRPKRRVTTPPFETTAYGGLLQKRAREGLYPAPVRGGLLRRYGETIGGETQRQRAGITGGLVSRGMFGSIAGLRALGEPERRRTGLLGGYARELDIESEMGKQRAEDELARLSTEWAMRRRAEEEGIRLEGAQARMGLLGGLGETGMGLYRGLMGRQFVKTEEGRLEKEREAGFYMDRAEKMQREGNIEEAEKLWDMAKRILGGAKTGLLPYYYGGEAGIKFPYYVGRDMYDR